GFRGRRARMTNPKQILRIMFDGLDLLHRSSLLRRYVRQDARKLRWRRLDETQPRRAAAFIRRYTNTFRSVQTEPQSDAKRVLVIGGGVSGRIEVELCLVKALELAGWLSMPLLIEATLPENKGLDAYYSLLSQPRAHSWLEYCEPAPLR